MALADVDHVDPAERGGATAQVMPACGRLFYGPSCAQIATKALALGAPGDWSRYLDPAEPLNPLNHPSAYICEGDVLATATVDRFSP